MNVDEELRRRARPATVAQLLARRSDIHAHVARVRALAERRDFVDVRTMRRVADELEALLDHAGSLDAAQRSIVWAAIDYFVDESDDEADLTSPLGFDDDAEVTAAAARAASPRRPPGESSAMNTPRSSEVPRTF